MKFVIAGASGFLGTAWSEHLERQGHEVTRLVRGPAGQGESSWDPYTDQVPLDLIEQADVVANLAGASLPKVPFSAKYRRTFRDSRVVTTRALSTAIVSVGSKPAFVAQNGTAGYGDHGDEWITEDTPTDADAFLAEVTREWAAATLPAEEAGARVVTLRTSVVLDGESLTLKVMRIPFLLGLGGPIGTGEQFFPTISLNDWLRAATFLAESESASGVFNVGGPEPKRQKDFAKDLAHALHRPAFLRVPAWPLSKVLGPAAPEVLNSQRVRPARLLDAGFTFEHPTVEAQLAAALG